MLSLLKALFVKNSMSCLISSGYSPPGADLESGTAKTGGKALLSITSLAFSSSSCSYFSPCSSLSYLAKINHESLIFFGVLLSNITGNHHFLSVSEQLQFFKGVNISNFSGKL